MTEAGVTGAAVPPPRRLRQATVVSYGFGAVAYGVKDTGFNAFLLFYYNQVMGLPQTTVSLVIMAALVIDAFADPLIGFMSDRTRSRWGRRHPWMYGSALPIMIGYVLVWSPPADATPTQLLVWLFTFAVLTRTAVSTYEVPSVALAPELTSDYDERTRILAWRYLWGWLGAIAIGLVAWGVFFRATPAYPNGQSNPAVYGGLALTAAAMMGVAILVSALATHREIPNLPRAGADTGPTSLADNFRELRQTLNNRGFAVLMLAGFCTYANQGVITALGVYVNAHVWGFTTGDFIIQTLGFVLCAALAFALAPRLGKRRSKPQVACAAVLGGAFMITLPYWLRAAGLLPPLGDASLPKILIAIQGVGTSFNIVGFILAASMMADVVEESEARTGRRDEGVFFAGAFFMQKCTSGIGIFLAGIMLAIADFPEKAVPGQVAPAVLDRLAWIHAVAYLLTACVAAYVFTRFPFGRAEHEARLAKLGAGTA